MQNHTLPTSHIIYRQLPAPTQAAAAPHQDAPRPSEASQPDTDGMFLGFFFLKPVKSDNQPRRGARADSGSEP